MNKHLRLSFIAIACSLAITACSSDNKGATRYEDLVKNKVDEANKKAEEKAKKDKESETAKKLAELEKKQKELEQQLKQKNQEAPKTEPKVDPKVEPQKEDMMNDNNEKNQQLERDNRTNIQDKLKNVLIDNGRNASDIAYLSGMLLTIDKNSTETRNIPKLETLKLNELIVDGQKITLFPQELIAKFEQVKIRELTNKDFTNSENKNYSGKVGSLPERKLSNDFVQTRYGYYTDGNKTTLFVQGYLTPTDSIVKSPANYYKGYKEGEIESLRTLPKEGVIKYEEGRAFYGKDNIYKEYIATGIADFNDKKVKIEVKENDSTKFAFGGKIKGNTFYGVHDGIVSKGAFFGTHGQDIAGTFYQTKGDEKDYNGVFGITKKGYNPIADKDAIKDFQVSE